MSRCVSLIFYTEKFQIANLSAISPATIKQMPSAQKVLFQNYTCKYIPLIKTVFSAKDIDWAHFLSHYQLEEFISLEGV